MSKYEKGDEIVFKSGVMSFYGVERPILHKGIIANVRMHPDNKKLLFDMYNIQHCENSFNAKRMVIEEHQILKKL